MQKGITLHQYKIEIAVSVDNKNCVISRSEYYFIHSEITNLSLQTRKHSFDNLSFLSLID
jgi:hypothetical protein